MAPRTIFRCACGEKQGGGLLLICEGPTHKVPRQFHADCVGYDGDEDDALCQECDDARNTESLSRSLTGISARPALDCRSLREEESSRYLYQTVRHLRPFSSVRSPHFCPCQSRPDHLVVHRLGHRCHTQRCLLHDRPRGRSRETSYRVRKVVVVEERRLRIDVRNAKNEICG